MNKIIISCSPVYSISAQYTGKDTFSKVFVGIFVRLLLHKASLPSNGSLCQPHLTSSTRLESRKHTLRNSLTARSQASHGSGESVADDDVTHKLFNLLKLDSNYSNELVFKILQQHGLFVV